MNRPDGFDYSILIVDRGGEWREVGIDATRAEATRRARAFLIKLGKLVWRPIGCVSYIDQRRAWS